MDWAKLVAALVPSAIALLVGIYVGRLGFRAEAMKLRHSVAERRIKEFDGAAGDLLAMLLEIGSQRFDTPIGRAARRRFRDLYPSAVLKMLFAAELAMMPVHSDALTPSDKDLLRSCGDLYSHLATEVSPHDNGRERAEADLVAGVTMLVHLFMEAVDVSTEARVEGRSTRQYTARIQAIARRCAEEQRSGNTPQPGGDT